MSDPQELLVDGTPTTFLAAPDVAGQRLDVFLAAAVPGWSRSRLQRLIEQGHVLVNGAVKPSRHTLSGGETISVVVPAPTPTRLIPQQMDLVVLYEDDDVLVLNKPPGLAVHPGAGRPDGTLANALAARDDFHSTIGGEERPGIVHRLDLDTSGVMVVAKNDGAHAALRAALEARTVRRIYWAVVMRPLAQREGQVEAPIARHMNDRQRMAIARPGTGKWALTHYRVLEDYGSFSLVEFRLATGRTHQIRVHMSHIGHPVLGDVLYGGQPAVAQQLSGARNAVVREAIRGLTRQMLHARELEFVHPTSGAMMKFEADLPSDMAALIETLRAQLGNGVS